MNRKKLAAALLIGLAVGIATVLGQKFLPDSLNSFANSGAIWLIPPFLLSYFWKLNRQDCVIASIVTLIGCVAGYYLFEALVNAHSVTLNQWTGLWTAMAFVGGAVCGTAAHAATDGGGIWKPIGQNLLPAALLSESLDKFLHFREYSHLLPSMIASIGLAALVYFAIHRRESIRIRSASALALLVVPGTGFFEVLYQIST